MSEQPEPASRDFVEREIGHLRELHAERIAHVQKMGELRLIHLRELHEQRFEARDAARRLQAKEYKRRLKVLNHAHTNAVEAQAKTVPREVYDNDHNAFQAQFGALRDQVLSDVAAKTARSTVYSSVLAVAMVVVGWILMWFRVRGG